MKTYTKLIATLITLHFGAYATNVTAETYIDLNFETTDTGLSPVSSKGYPLWILRPAFDLNIGPGNLFEISSTTSHSGDNSLRFVYEGRNNFCNTCGTTNVIHKKDLNGVDYFVADDGQDLTLEQVPVLDSAGQPVLNAKGIAQVAQLPHVSPGKILYNKSRGYSQWQVVSVGNNSTRNDKLTLKLLRPGIGAYKDQPSIFNSKDSISIARQCGVDGTIGKVDGKFDLARRSDCNGAINWFGEIYENKPDNQKVQPSGTSIFRRVYLKAEITAAPAGHKLNYMKLKGVSLVTVANTEELALTISGLATVGGEMIYKPGTNGMPDSAKFERGVWYYIEQEYKAETYTTTKVSVDPGDGSVTIDGYSGDGNGEYRLWFAKSGEETDTPALEVKGLSLPPMTGGGGNHMSLFGNEGHHFHTRGSWYMDDIKISNTRIGFNDVARNGKNRAAPMHPKTDE